MTAKEIQDLISNIRACKNRKIPSKELALATELIFWGLSKDEIHKLMIAEIYDSDWEVKPRIGIRRSLPVPDNLRKSLEEYALYLQKRSGWQFLNSDCLLQRYRCKRTLDRHLEKFGLSYKDIRNNRFDDFISRPSATANEFSAQFGVTKDYASKMIRGVPQPCGHHVRYERMISEAEGMRLTINRLNIHSPVDYALGKEILKEAIQKSWTIRSRFHKTMYESELDTMLKRLSKFKTC